MATAFIFCGLMGAAQSTKVYQFILSFISLGLGNGIGLTLVIGVLNHWFLRKRGFVTGMVTSGGSIGGLVFPLLLRFLFDKYGYVWAIRILAFITGGCMLVSLVTLKERVYRKKESKEQNPQKRIFSFQNDGNNRILRHCQRDLQSPQRSIGIKLLD